jgi:tetratricopeptide (TPR) repeat protein
MGRIDTDLMFDIVKKWDWGNSGSDKIYHDPQTRSQGLSFRGNLARLMETLIAENKIDKAREVIEIAMTNMPVDKYGFYAFVEPFVDGYYKVGDTDKARDLFEKLKKVYQERLEYYAGTPLDEQYGKIDDILADMQAYRRNIDILIENQDRELAESETLIFNEYIDKFSQFVGDEDDTFEEPTMEPNPDLKDSIPLDTLNPVEDSTTLE